MNTLPASIESHLKEAGFTGTEVLALRHLFAGDALSIRELAAKTGKSTGVLDQAVKKLMRKHIISKSSVNNAPRYRLRSVDALTHYLKRDVVEKRKVLKRKEQDFDQFLATVKVDQSRPDMEYFEGEQGIQQAYLKLLEVGAKEMLHYFPIICKEEEDPFHDFRNHYFRQRMKRGIFQRVLAPDIPLGRRFQTRDPFAYRKTVLIPETEVPFSFEKIIVGNIVACCHYAEEKVCFIHFPHLAESESLLFESTWTSFITRPQGLITTASIPPPPKTPSRLREFFVGNKRVRALFVCLLCLAVLTGLQGLL